MIVASALGLTLSCIGIVGSLLGLIVSGNPVMFVVTTVSVITALACMDFGSVGAAMMIKGENMEEVELLTSETVQQLPAGETLVRSSSEPTAEQEKVLLRAATAGAEETAPEQLLRPTTPDF